MTQIVVVAADATFGQRVRAALSRPDGDGVLLWEKPLAGAADVQALADRAPAAVILGPKLGKEAAFSLAAYFDRTFPAIGVLVVAVPGPETWQRALDTGVRGIISPVATDDELRSNLNRVLQHARGRPAPAAVAAPEAPRARVITVFSPKGGSGKTILSTNLAVGLAARAPGSVVLLDLDLQFGNIGYALGLTPQHTISDAVSVLDDLDATTLKVLLSRHRSGLYALCAPNEPAAGDAIPTTAVTAVIKLFASQFGYVVIDTAAGLGEHTLAALDLSTDVIVLSDMDVPSVRDLRKALDALDVLGLRAPTRHFVLNRADSRVGLTRAGITAAAGTTVDVEIPSSRDVPVSLNEGRPLLSDNPRSPVARHLAELVERIANGNGHGAPAGRGGGS